MTARSARTYWARSILLSVAAAGAFGVVAVNRAPVDRRDGGRQIARLVQRVGMQGHLYVVIVSDGQRAVDGRGCRAPVLVHLESARARMELFDQGLGTAAVALGEQSDVDR